MALVVASTTTVTTNNADNLTITKPSGVQVGDLLVIIASGFLTGAITSSGFTSGLSVSNVVGGDTAERQCNIEFLYRIADSSDVSASNYTIAQSGSDSLGNACMLRITGWTTGNPILSSANTTGTFATVDGPTSLGQTGLSLSRGSNGIAILGYTLNNSDGATNIFTFSNYSITSSESNPTWTEVIDAGATVNGNLDAATNHLSVAYANFTTLSTITAYNADFTESTSGAAGHAQFLAILCEPNSPTADISRLDLAPSIYGVEATQVNVNPDIGHLTANPNINGIAGKSSSDGTRWVNEPSTTTVWVNDQI